jgi:hypothetical protein
MTEAEWDACTDPQAMLEVLRGRASERKLRLFACGCQRLVWPLIDDGGSPRALEVAERLADGVGEAEDLEAAWGTATYHSPQGWNVPPHILWPGRTRAYEALDQLRWMMPGSEFKGDRACGVYAPAVARTAQRAAGNAGLPDTREQWAKQAQRLRDLFGNPFRPAPVIDPAWILWHGGAIPQLAHSVYDERLLPAGTFDHARLALLADMLTDAGCTDADILGHLRSGGEHVRGCWVVDLLLGRF